MEVNNQIENQSAMKRTKETNNLWEGVTSLTSFLLSGIFIGVGFYKLFVYENPDSILLQSANAYVGGDAYNYIINAGQATAYFVLATLFAIVGSVMLVLIKMNDNK